MCALTCLHPGQVKRKLVLLLQDNAHAHTSKVVREKVEELGIGLLPHPAYTPNLAPSDYYLLRSLSQFPEGKSFETVDDVENAVIAFFTSKPPEWCQRGIIDLPVCWLKTIEHNGSYFKE